MSIDFNGFNKVTYPNYFAKQPTLGSQRRLARNLQVTPTAEPAPDNRYPAYSGHMEDAQNGTDYRPHCSSNLPPGTQFTTKLWQIHHTESLINLSRQRQAEWSGSSLPLAKTIPPPAVMVFSSPFENELVPTQYRAGLGVERADSKTPPLFGTFVVPPTPKELCGNTKNIALTKRYQGGRNTPRGLDHYIPS
jgi:hypothetical protein